MSMIVCTVSSHSTTSTYTHTHTQPNHTHCTCKHTLQNIAHTICITSRETMFATYCKFRCVECTSQTIAHTLTQEHEQCATMHFYLCHATCVSFVEEHSNEITHITLGLLNWMRNGMCTRAVWCLFWKHTSQQGATMWGKKLCSCAYVCCLCCFRACRRIGCYLFRWRTTTVLCAVWHTKAHRAAHSNVNSKTQAKQKRMFTCVCVCLCTHIWTPSMRSSIYATNATQKTRAHSLIAHTRADHNSLTHFVR